MTNNGIVFITYINKLLTYYHNITNVYATFYFTLPTQPKLMNLQCNMIEQCCAAHTVHSSLNNTVDAQSGVKMLFNVVNNILEQCC